MTSLIVIKPDDHFDAFNVADVMNAYVHIINTIKDQTDSTPNQVVTVYYNDLKTYGNTPEAIATSLLRQCKSTDKIYIELMLTENWKDDELATTLRADTRVIYFSADWVGVR